MDEQTRASFTDDLRDDFFRRVQLNPRHFKDLGGFENIVLADQSTVVRITHVGHRDRQALLGELEFVSYLADQQCAVSRPLAVGDQLVVSMGDWHLCLFERAAGERLPDHDWNDNVVNAWGQAIGRFHRVTRAFSPEYQRMSWREDENHNFKARIPEHMKAVLQVAEDVMTRLGSFSEDSDDFGLIHGDAHPGNFLVHRGQPTFFDFDDAIYVWFAYDIATILFSVVLRESIGQDSATRAQVASRFLDHFLEGYCRETEVTSFMATEMHTFLKLRELSLFAVVHRFMDLANLDEFPARFMKGRQQSLEVGAPFLDIDFVARMS